MAIITLLTDFGLSDTFIGVMKGVIWSIAPDVKIADLTHAVSPQNVLEGAYAIAESAPYFPSGTIHVCVVDPGVGTMRRPMAALIGGQYFIGPDNGLFTILLDQTKDFTVAPVLIHLNHSRFWLKNVSKSFHGRDIFAPVASHLAAGTKLEELGDPFNDPVRIELPRPQKTAQGWVGKIIRIDHFGNLVTNLTAAQLTGQAGVKLNVGNNEITEFVDSFGDRAPGSLIAMIDSGGYLAVSEVNGSAAARLSVKTGDLVELKLNAEGIA